MVPAAKRSMDNLDFDIPDIYYEILIFVGDSARGALFEPTLDRVRKFGFGNDIILFGFGI